MLPTPKKPEQIIQILKEEEANQVATVKRIAAIPNKIKTFQTAAAKIISKVIDPPTPSVPLSKTLEEDLAISDDDLIDIPTEISYQEFGQTNAKTVSQRRESFKPSLSVSNPLLNVLADFQIDLPPAIIRSISDPLLPTQTLAAQALPSYKPYIPLINRLGPKVLPARSVPVVDRLGPPVVPIARSVAAKISGRPINAKDRHRMRRKQILLANKKRESNN